MDTTKTTKLKDLLLSYGKIALAYSGGVDSTFLLRLCVAYKIEMLAVTIKGANFAPDETDFAIKVCRDYEIPHKVIDLGDDLIRQIRKNPPDRCYACKKAMFKRICIECFGYTVIDGSNTDDLKDYRPGRRAIEELRIKSPLIDAGFSKEEIRESLMHMGSSIWNKPAYACLASRVPYGETLTVDKLKMIYSLEHFLKTKGISQVRVRCHNADGVNGDKSLIARIELLPEEFSRMDPFFIREIDAAGKKAGFAYVSLDLGGYKAGNMNK